MRRRASTIESSLRIAFADEDEPASIPPITIHVNFGVLAGREATPAEIDHLADSLLLRAAHVTVVSETRHEIDRHSEAAVHQVRIEVPRELSESGAELEPWLVEQAERWTRHCAAERMIGTGDV